MVLNHASLESPDLYRAVEWLKDATAGIALLTKEKVAAPVIRMQGSETEMLCMPERSLWDVLMEMQRAGAREESIFFLKLTTKVPLLSDVSEEIENRFYCCESKTFPAQDGEPLVFAAIADHIAIGFPSEPTWDKCQLTVTFAELMFDGSVEEATEVIDSLTRSAHARGICDRRSALLRGRLRECRDGPSLWAAKEEAFPNLWFGLEVEEHLASLNPGLVGTVINKLAKLEDSAVKWREAGGTTPPWQTTVTDESSSVRNNPTLLRHRRFRSNDGTRQHFTWHARYGSKGRIHLKFCQDSHCIEIGYIGNHLPL